MSVLPGHSAGSLSLALSAAAARPWWRRLLPGRGGSPQPSPRPVLAESTDLALPGMDDVHADLRRAEQALSKVTDREELPERLADCERARAAFLAQLHHELRTPTTTLMGYLEVLQDGDGGVLTPVQRWMLRRAEEGALRLAGVLDELRRMQDCAAHTRQPTEGR